MIIINYRNKMKDKKCKNKIKETNKIIMVKAIQE